MGALYVIVLESTREVRLVAKWLSFIYLTQFITSRQRMMTEMTTVVNVEE